jgi:hypothetical protein
VEGLDGADAVDQADLTLDDPATAIKHEQGGYGAHVEAQDALAAKAAQGVDAHEFGFWLDVTLDPVDDGLCQQAGRSGVAEKLDNDRITARYQFRPLARCGIGLARAQREEGSSKQNQNDDQRPVAGEPFQQ